MLGHYLIYYRKYLWRQVNFYSDSGGIYEKELTGCGASFSISATDLEKYSEDNSAVYADMSDSYTETYDYLDGLYVMEKDDVHIELWDLDTTQNASKWFESNVEDIKEGSKSSSGSSTSSGGSYTISTDDLNIN